MIERPGPLPLSCETGGTDPPSGIATFRHLVPPNSAIFSYATEGALFISLQLSTDAVSPH